MVKRKDLGWIDIYANQYWHSIQLTPSISIDFTRGLYRQPRFRRIEITFAFLPWWLSFQFPWEAKKRVPTPEG